MSPLVGRLLLLVFLVSPLYGVEKVRNRGYRKDPDADKVSAIKYDSRAKDAALMIVSYSRNIY